jgi:hypothetical protein
MSTLWRGLETVGSRLTAVAASWQRHMGEDFQRVRTSLISHTGREASSVPSRFICDCRLRVVKHAADDIVGISDCETVGCNDVTLTAAEIELLELKMTKLARAVSSALGCDLRQAETDIEGTQQIATYGEACLPVVFAVPRSQRECELLVRQLIWHYSGNFVVLVPSTRFIDGNAQSALRKVNAGIFALESFVTVTEDGSLRSNRTAAELFGSCGQVGSAPRDVGLVKTIEKIGRDIEAVARNTYELQTARARLEQMQGENLFRFVQKIDSDAFRIVCAILACGDVAKASRALEMKDSTVRDVIRSWERRGEPYRGLLRLVQWRKGSRIKGTVPFNDAMLHKKEESAREAILADVLDGLMGMTEGNWEDVCEELKELLRNNG